MKIQICIRNFQNIFSLTLPETQQENIGKYHRQKLIVAAAVSTYRQKAKILHLTFQN